MPLCSGTTWVELETRTWDLTRGQYNCLWDCPGRRGFFPAPLPPPKAPGSRERIQLYHSSMSWPEVPLGPRSGQLRELSLSHKSTSTLGLSDPLAPTPPGGLAEVASMSTAGSWRKNFPSVQLLLFAPRTAVWRLWLREALFIIPV